MTGKAPLAAGLAVAASLAVHGALLARILPSSGGTETPPGVAEVSMLGQSFEDLVAGGVATAAPPANAIRPAQPAPPLAAIAPTPPVAAVEPTTSVAPSVIPTTIPAAPVTAPRSTPAVTAAVPERIAARNAPVAQRPTEATPRPQARPPRPEPAPAAAPPPSQGNSDRTAAEGTAEGRTGGTASQQQGDTDAAPGPSARQIARYPQQVNRHLSRLRRPNSSVTGAAVVGFTIAPSGGLASVGIVRSSGDAAFDELALRHIRGAVPFPPPPEGAQTRYSVAVRGR
jgi:protein TonB